MTWLKHELLFAALMATDRVFYFDVDVLILRNPWIEVSEFVNSYFVYVCERVRQLISLHLLLIGE